jgi:CTP synthase (UTP-ammonia lyase)
MLGWRAYARVCYADVHVGDYRMYAHVSSANVCSGETTGCMALSIVEDVRRGTDGHTIAIVHHTLGIVHGLMLKSTRTYSTF